MKFLIMKNKRRCLLLAFGALALASPCQAQHQRTGPRTILHRNRRWIRGKTLFKQTRQKECMPATSGNSVVPNGGDWWLIVNDGTYKTGRGKIHNPNVTFVASDEDWVAMSNKTLNVSLAYLTGRLKIQGSHGLVKELDKIFP